VSDLRNVIIVGSGPAGLTAAIYAGRANLSPLIVAGSQPGGQLTLTSEVENYPGFAEPVLGPELMDVMRGQAERFGTEFVDDDVVGVDLSSRPFEVKTAERTWRARALIVATGASARLLGLESERRLLGRGLSTCATCDGFFFKGQELVVVGGGDSAMEEATFLTRFADKVYVIHRKDSLRASKAMQDRAFNDPKIEFLWNKEVAHIYGDDLVSGIGLIDTVDGTESTKDLSGLFIAIGADPRTHLVHGQLELTDLGTIAVDGRSSRTKLPGVFAAGDVIDPHYRQAVTAAASGTVAALDAEQYLAALDQVEESSRVDLAAALADEVDDLVAAD